MKIKKKGKNYKWIGSQKSNTNTGANKRKIALLGGKRKKLLKIEEKIRKKLKKRKLASDM